MLTKKINEQAEIIMYTMEQIVPQDSLYRKIDKYIDFSFIYEEVKELYNCRKETIERSFADSKNNHGYRYAMYKGVEKNQNYTWLICAAQNMKIIAMKCKNKGTKPFKNSIYLLSLNKILKFILKIQILYKNTNLVKNYTRFVNILKYYYIKSNSIFFLT